MTANPDKEKDLSDINIMIKNNNNTNNTNILKAISLKGKSNNSLIKSNNSISQNMDLKEKPNINNSPPTENKTKNSKKRLILIISLSSLTLLLIIGIILIIGNVQYGCLKTKKSLLSL